MTEPASEIVAMAAQTARNRRRTRWIIALASLNLTLLLMLTAVAVAYNLRSAQYQQLADTNTRVADQLVRQVQGLGRAPVATPVSGSAGPQGPAGPAGRPGRGVASTAIVGGHLVVRYTDGTTQDLGQVVGATGVPGQTGATGRGVASTVITTGHLVVVYTDGSTTDVGQVVGPAGAVGATGATGPAGRGVASVTINSASHLIVTYTDGSTADAGQLPAGPAGPAGGQGAQGVSVTDVQFARDSSGNCQVVVTLHDPAAGTDSTITHSAGDAACPVAAPILTTTAAAPNAHHR